MKIFSAIISYVGLGLTIIPSGLVMFGQVDFEQNKLLAGLGMLLWFLTAPFWINKGKGTE